MVTEVLKPIKPQVLVVDDSKVARWTISKILGEKYLVHAAEDTESALAMLHAEGDIALVLCDLQVPGMGWHKFLKGLRESRHPRLVNLPIIMVTDEDDEPELKEQLLEEGATDFVHKPFDESELRGRIAAYVTHQQQVMRLERDVELDPISGLAGRSYFQLHVERNLTLSTRHKTEFTLAVMEIDDYQKLLSKLGNEIFNQLLFQIGKSIKKIIRTEDLAARIDQARIGLVLPLTNRVGGRLAVERVCKEIDSMVLSYGGENLKISLSVGMAAFEFGSVLSTHGLISRSEEALQRAIDAGGNCVVGAEQLDMQGSAAVDQPSSWITGDPSIESMRKIQAGATDSVSDQELMQILTELRPVLELANQRFNLGLSWPLPQELND